MTREDSNSPDALRAEVARRRQEVRRLRASSEAQAELGSELRVSRQRLFQLVDQSPIAVIEWDPDFCVVEWNAAAERTFGISREEARGRHARMIVPDDLWPQVSSVWAELPAQEGGSRSRNENITVDGRRILCEWYNGPRTDRDGNVVGVISLAEDITERVRAEEERRRLSLQMERTAKLESLEVLAGGVAHDFDNLLVGILGSAGLALLDLPPESPARTHIELIENTAQRAADLTRQMLAVSGKGRFVVSPASLSRLVGERTHLLEASIEKNVLLRFQLEPHIPTVEADVTQLRQVLMNLMLNASVPSAIGAVSSPCRPASSAPCCWT